MNILRHLNHNHVTLITMLLKITRFIHPMLCRRLVNNFNTKNRTQTIIHQTCQMSAKPSVYITRRVPQSGIDVLTPHCELTQWDSDDPVPRDELLRNVVGKDALFCLLTEKIDKELLDAAGPQLKVVSTMSVGFDHIDIEECKKRNIPVGYTPDVLTNAVAELTVALALTTSRRFKEAMRAVVDGSWGTWKPMWLCGQGLDGATVGIVGLGRIGFAVAQRVRPFGVDKILYFDTEKKQYAQDIGAEFSDFDNLLKNSDFVFCCSAFTPENKGLFNAEVFDKMKQSAVFINTSRGGLVNQGDLYQALVSGSIGAAGLDVTTPEPIPIDDPLTKLDNCVILPHIASATEKTRSAMSELTAKNIVCCLKGEKMPVRVF